MAAPRERESKSCASGRFIVCFGLALVIYLPRAYRALCLGGDSAELVTAAALWGVPHAPGYPLYVLVGRALTLLPWLELPFRVHLGSAIFHAATVTVVAAVIERITRRTGPALLGAATLALARVFFSGSLYAEVFPLNDLLFATLLHLGTRVAYDERPPWIAFSATSGVALAHHPMIALGLPAVAVLVGPAAARLMRRQPWLAARLALLALVIPAVAWGLVPLAAARNPLLSWDNVHDLRSLAALVTRQDYGGLFHASRRPVVGQLLERLDAFALSTAGFGWVGLALAAIGIVWGLRHARRVCAALLLAFASSGPLFAGLNAVDLHSEYRRAFFERFTSMSHVPLAVFVGFGAVSVFDWMRGEPRLSRGFRLPMLSGSVALLAIGPLVYAARDLDFHRDRVGIAYAHDLVASTPERSLVLLKGDMATQAALYACGVEQRCGDRIVLAPLQWAMPWKLEQDRRRHPELELGGATAREFTADDGLAKLVGRELSRRPVFVHAELLEDVLRGEESAVPAMLLYRVYADERALRADPDARAKLTAMTTGDGCEGCALPRSPRPYPSLDAQVHDAYDAARRASFTASEQLGLAGH